LRVLIHRAAAVGVQGEGALVDVVFARGLADEVFGQVGGLAVGDHPADDAAAVDVDDRVKRVPDALVQAADFGDAPGPDPVGGARTYLLDDEGVQHTTERHAPNRPRSTLSPPPHWRHTRR
jgi:hypothetical protein